MSEKVSKESQYSFALPSNYHKLIPNLPKPLDHPSESNPYIIKSNENFHSY